MSVLGTTAWLVFVCLAAAPPSEPQNRLTEAQQQAGWRLLFDGKTTQGWRGYKMDRMPPGWKVLDGALVRVSGGAGGKGAGGGDDIITVEQFDNFELELEWKIVDRAGNSGIILRASEDALTSWHTGPEVQILDNAAYPGRSVYQLAGACYDLYAPAKDASRPRGQWNAVRIVADGRHIEHWLNGEKLLEYELGSDDWTQRVAKSKFRNMPHFQKPPSKGHICLQDHTARIEYRNIKIRPLPPKTAPQGILFRESFEDADLAKRGWYDGDRFRIVGGARAGQGCIEYEWTDPQGKVQGSSGARRLFDPTDEVAIRFYLKLSKGWGWSGRTYHPHLTHFLTTENSKWHGPAASHLTLYIEPVAGKLRLAAQDIQNKDMPHGLTQGPLRGGYNGRFYDSTEPLFTDDQWHSVEAYFKLNTLDLENDRPNRDGIVRGWFDGKLVIEHTDVVFRSTDFPKMKFNHFLMAPYFGPGLLPHAQKLWIDELAVGTQRIGPLAD